jgi:hypothetical protein
MKTFNFIQAVISYSLEYPHSKALEPDCLSPWPSIKTQAPGRGEKWEVLIEPIIPKFFFTPFLPHRVTL